MATDETPGKYTLKEGIYQMFLMMLFDYASAI